jgi:hypothetical protein
MDKSAELRRLVELGMAAELAGFSLDGTVLRFGGRVWDMRSEGDQVGAVSLPPVAPAGAAPLQGSTTTSAVAAPLAPAPEESDVGTQNLGVGAASAVLPMNDVAGSNAAKVEESPLLANLRGLAGRS